MTQAVSDKCVGTLSAKWRDSLSDKSLDNTNRAAHLKQCHKCDSAGNATEPRQRDWSPIVSVAEPRQRDWSPSRQRDCAAGRLLRQPRPEYECSPLKYMLTTVKLKITEAMPMRLRTATFVGPQPRVARAWR